MKTLKKQFKKDWDKINLIKIFEISVFNKNTNESDYIIFNISIDGDNFIAQHEPTTKDEEESKKIAYCGIEIDYDYSIDVNLQELYEECINKIIDSDFFILN